MIYHIERDNYDEAIKLLEEGANPNSESLLYEQTPILKLSHYSDKQNLEMAELLLEYGADPNWINPYGMTPLLIAVASDNTEMVCLLIKYSVDVNYNKDGRSALSDARTRSNFEIEQLLLDSGAVE